MNVLLPGEEEEVKMDDDLTLVLRVTSPLRTDD